MLYSIISCIRDTLILSMIHKYEIVFFRISITYLIRAIRTSIINHNNFYIIISLIYNAFKTPSKICCSIIYRDNDTK